MFCNIENCATSKEQHEFDAPNCRLNSTDDLTSSNEEMSSNIWTASFNQDTPQNTSRYYCLSADSDNDSDTVVVLNRYGCNAEEETSAETELNRAHGFYFEWNTKEKREILKNDPHSIITSLMASFPNPELRQRFHSASRLFHQFEGEFLFNLLAEFLSDQYPEDLFCFDIYIRGCLKVYQRCQSVMKKSFQKIHESLESCVTKAFEASAKTQAECSITQAIIRPLEELRLDLKSTAIQLQGYICSPVCLIINSLGLLDGAETLRVNSDLSILDAPFLQKLESLSAESISLISVMSWRELKELHPIDQTCCSRALRDMIWANYKSMYTDYKAIYPKLFPIISYELNLEGFMCYPVCLITNNQGTLDATTTMRVNDCVTLSDVPLLQSLECLSFHELSVLSQLSWKELKALNPTDENMNAMDRRELIWTKYYYKYEGHKPRSPGFITLASRLVR